MTTSDIFTDYLQEKYNISGFANVSNISKPLLVTSVDGVGTKLEIARHYSKYDTIGIDLVAMVMNDIIVHGGTPSLFLDYYATDVLDLKIGKSIIEGIQIGCEIANCKLVGGETAEMPLIYNSGKFDLVGFGIGFTTDQEILPRNINKKDLLIGFPSSGIHSNGYTLINTLPICEDYLTPTKIYIECLSINHLINGLVHITGGGLKNIKRIVPHYRLTDWKFPDIFREIQDKLKLSRHEMLDTFNCGFGMVAIVSPENIDYINLDYSIIGEVT